MNKVKLIKLLINDFCSTVLKFSENFVFGVYVIDSAVCVYDFFCVVWEDFLNFSVRKICDLLAVIFNIFKCTVLKFNIYLTILIMKLNLLV